MFMNTPELLTIGQQMFDKCITDMQNNGLQIPNSDVQVVKMLEEYLSGMLISAYVGMCCVLLPLVDYMEEEEEVEVNTEQIEAEVNNMWKSSTSIHCSHTDRYPKLWWAP